MGVLPLGQLPDLVRDARPLQTVPHFGTIYIFPSGLGHVFRHRSRQDGKLLEHGGEVLVVVPAVILPDVLPIQQHLSLRGIVEAAEELDKGGLSRAVAAHHRQLLAGMERQVNMGQGVMVRAGVAEAHVPQLQGIQMIFLHGQRLAVPEAKQLRLLHELPQGGKVQALPVEGPQSGEDARHPLGEAADRREVQHERRRRQLSPQGHGDEQAVGRAVAQKRQRHVQQVRPHILAVGLDVEVLHQPGVLFVQLRQPGADAEDADVLGQLHVPAAVDHVVRLVHQRGLLLPVAVAPGPDMLPREVARGGQGDAQRRHPRPHLGQQQQVDDEADDVGQQLRQSGPDVFSGVAVAVQAAACLARPLHIVRVLDMGVGGPAEGHVHVQTQPGADPDTSKQAVGVQIGPQGPDRRHAQGEPEDHPDKRSGPRAPLHRLQDGGDHEQLQQVCRRAAENQPQDDGQDAFAVPPRPANHEGAVLKDVVGFLLGFFHVSHLEKEHSTSSPVCVDRGTNRYFQGTNCRVTPPAAGFP